MATIKVVLTELPNAGEGKAWVASWPNMQNTDVGEVIEAWEFFDRSLQVSGTFGAGGSCALKGSNDKTNFVALTDPQGVAIAVTTAGIKAVTEVARQVRPEITAGDGTTSLTVTMFLRRTKMP